MDQKLMKKLAAQFDALAETLTAIGGTFRSAGGDSEDEGGDEPAGKPVRRTRTSKAAAPAKGKAATSEITQDTLREKLKDLAGAKGKEKMAEALAEVGAGRLPEVEEDDYEALDAAIDKLMAAKDKASAAKRGKAKKAAPTYDEVEEKFKELLAADKDAARAVLKEAGLKKLSESDADDEGAMTDLMTAITEALEAGDEEEDEDMV